MVASDRGHDGLHLGIAEHLVEVRHPVLGGVGNEASLLEGVRADRDAESERLEPATPFRRRCGKAPAPPQDGLTIPTVPPRHSLGALSTESFLP